MMDYHEAIKAMHTGAVVQYIGTENGSVWTSKGCKFCMCRGVTFEYRDNLPKYKSDGAMVYDPDFRYKLTGESVDPRYWPTKERIDKETYSNLSYARVGMWGRK